MPFHRVATDEFLDQAISGIEKSERITAVVPQGDGALLIFTEAKRSKPGPKETR